MGKPVSLLAVGVGPFYSRVGRSLVAGTARLAAVRTVRDAASAQALRSLGVARVEVGADPTYSTEASYARPAADAHRTRSVLVSLRWFLRDADQAAQQQRLRDAVLGGLEDLVAHGWGGTFASRTGLVTMPRPWHSRRVGDSPRPTSSTMSSTGRPC